MAWIDVSATKITLPRLMMTDTPMTRRPSFGSSTRRTSCSAVVQFLVTPVTIASAWPSASMQAPKMFRS